MTCSDGGARLVANRRRRKIEIGALLAYLAVLIAPAHAGARVVWKADAERPIAAEWASSSSIPEASAPPRPDPSRIGRSDFAAQGRASYRFELRAGDGSYGARAELGQALPSRAAFRNRWFRAGAERWIALQYWFPPDWPRDATWQNVLQIKPVTAGGGGPDIGIDAGGGRLLFYGNARTWGSTSGGYRDGSGAGPGGSFALTRGRWIALTLHVVFSSRASEGMLEVFGDLRDGRGMRTLVPRRHRPTMKRLPGGATDPVHLRVGIYRDPAIRATGRLFVDGITVATTRRAAESNAYRSG
jgi:hypothetical protein